MKSNREKGREGERLAVEFLKKQGVKIIEKNWKTRFGEIDLIGLDKGCVVFIEVKWRKNSSFGHPLESITPAKIKKIFATAKAYLKQMGWTDREVRFDVVGIEGENINYIKGVLP